ncbi:phosphatase PAP2 family protein [Longispora albida]|uniref:phosphatase PAP2 family protein n=1 Tax=Longispora albida TaxID=203523 RepID=UPI001B7FA588|nr:phosphatase PAP2 family protein [Longispora albida]
MRIPWRSVRPGWWLDVLALAAAVALTVALATGRLLAADLDVRDFLDAHRPGWLDVTLRVFNKLGQGSPLAVLCLAIGLWRVFREGGDRRSWRTWWPVYPIVFAYVLNLLTIGPIKVLTSRPAPKTPGADAAFFAGDGHMSYPSGHAINTLVWYTVLAILLAPWLSAAWHRVLRIAPVVIVAITTVYLGFHWLTDTLAGILLGLVLSRLISRVDWPALSRP